MKQCNAKSTQMQKKANLITTRKQLKLLAFSVQQHFNTQQALEAHMANALTNLQLNAAQQADLKSALVQLKQASSTLEETCYTMGSVTWVEPRTTK